MTDVVVLKRLVITPCVTGKYAEMAKFQRLMNAQALRDDSISSSMQPKETLEINTKHAVITTVTKALEADEKDKTITYC
jgi:molecular chaperone HtpG